MKWMAIVIGALLCLMPMAFAQQSGAGEGTQQLGAGEWTQQLGEVLQKPEVIGGILTGLLAFIVAGIVDLLQTIFSVAMAVWHELVGTAGDLWAGFNDIDLGSYLFQTAKILAYCVFMSTWCGTVFMGCYHAILFVWRYIPGVGAIHYTLRGCAQLALLWNNVIVQLCQHIVPFPL